MTGKERVRAALDLETPDMVPYGEFAIDFDTVEKILGRKTFLRNKAGSLRALWEGRWEEVCRSWVEDTIALAEAVPLDIVVAPRLPDREIEVPAQLDENTWEYADGRVLKYSPVTNDFTVVHYPQRDWLPSEAEMEAAANPPEPPEFRIEAVRRIVERFGADRHITWGGAPECAMPLFGGMANGLAYYATDPGRIRAWCEAECEGAQKTDRLWAGLGVDSVLWGMDFSYNAGSFLSPSMFHEMVTPFAKRRVDSAHEAGLAVLKHCCGNNMPLLDEFFRIGYDCYQSIQPTAGMDLKELKGLCAGKMALWGGVAVESLVSGTPDDVSRWVEYAMKHGKPGGGYIFGTSHSVAVGSKYENWLRMMDDFEKMRRY